MNPPQAASIPLVAFGLTEFFLRRGSAAKSLTLASTDRGTTPLILGCYGVVVCLLFLPKMPGTVLPSTVAWIGVGVAFAGLGVRWWAMTVLGRFYTRTLTTTSDHRVVDRGPYRWIRHPGYLGSLLTWAGAATASGNIIVVILVLTALILAYARRIVAEEAMLVEKLGPGYVDYRQRSWRLFPFVF